mmetsp:Transcript_13720/g.13783  ORF Transcript_13720/g.13783 Transcript_13720/m.13783 type:complete len:356 (-) Transcript_13720:73-1140(-)
MSAPKYFICVGISIFLVTIALYHTSHSDSASKIDNIRAIRNLSGHHDHRIKENSFQRHWNSRQNEYNGTYPGESIGGYSSSCIYDDTITTILNSAKIDILPENLTDRNNMYKEFLLTGSSCRFQRGLEIGALHNPAAVPDACKTAISFFDAISKEEALKLYPELDHAIKVDIIGDANDMNPVKDNTFDFLIASHVIEHMVLPILAVKNFLRVVRQNGYIFLIAPNMCKTFDHLRLVTSWAHLYKEHKSNKDVQHSYYMEHVREWTLSHLGSQPRNTFISPTEYEQTKQSFFSTCDTESFIKRGGMHMHAFDPISYARFIIKLSSPKMVESLAIPPFKILAMGFRELDMIAIIQKL